MHRFLFLLSLIVTTNALSIDARQFNDENKQARYEELIYELRCPVCQNQNLADSNAPLAKDLRDEVFSQIESGKSNKDIIDFMVLRYGEFIQYRPSFQVKTLLLWGAPVIFFLIGLTIVILTLRKQSEKNETIIEQEKLKQLLNEINQEEKEK